jgi:FHA domain
MPRFRIRLALEDVDLMMGATFFGRGPACTVTIPDPQMSRTHAVVFVDEHRAVLRDLGSCNGTRVNDKVVVRDVVLNDGDQVCFGRHELEFHVVTGVDAEESARRTTMRRLPTRAALASSPEESRQETMDLAPRTHDERDLDRLEHAVQSARMPDADLFFAKLASAIDAYADDAAFFRTPAFESLVERLAAASPARRSWLTWALTTLRRAKVPPTRHLVSLLAILPHHVVEHAGIALEELAREWRARGGGLDAQESALLSGLRRVLARVHFESRDGPLTQRGS